ncbi:MAG: hypothetical protein JXR37_04295 [Kiritimatiellae bacterium]|nr:hypothetical protein [Kiritimatiellia bacterium]
MTDRQNAAGSRKFLFVILSACALWLAVCVAGALLGRYRAQRRSFRHACIGNLRQIDGAKEQWAMMYGVTNGTPTGEQLGEFIKGGWRTVVCPSGGEYRINPLGEDPTCSIAGHSL